MHPQDPATGPGGPPAWGPQPDPTVALPPERPAAAPTAPVAPAWGPPPTTPPAAAPPAAPAWGGPAAPAWPPAGGVEATGPGSPAAPAPSPQAAAALGVRPPLPWLGILAAVAFVAAGVGVFLPWVTGTIPDFGASSTGVFELGELAGVPGLADLEPGTETTYTAMDVTAVGSSAGGLALAGAALAVAGVVLRRSVVFLATSAAAGVVALLAGLLLIVFRLVEHVEDLPYGDRIPADVQAELPDPQAGAGLWLYFVGAVVGAVLCSAAAVRVYRARYGVRTPGGPDGASSGGFGAAPGAPAAPGAWAGGWSTPGGATAP